MTKFLTIACITALTIAALCLLLAIWAPGMWWQWLLTGALMLFIGAGFGAEADKRKGKR